jgi:hypothetical protein
MKHVDLESMENAESKKDLPGSEPEITGGALGGIQLRIIHLEQREAKQPVP